MVEISCCRYAAAQCRREPPYPGSIFWHSLQRKGKISFHVWLDLSFVSHGIPHRISCGLSLLIFTRPALDFGCFSYDFNLIFFRFSSDFHLLSVCFCMRLHWIFIGFASDFHSTWFSVGFYGLKWKRLLDWLSRRFCYWHPADALCMRICHFQDSFDSNFLSINIFKECFAPHHRLRSQTVAFDIVFRLTPESVSSTMPMTTVLCPGVGAP